MPDVEAPAAPRPRVPARFTLSLALLTATLVVCGVLRSNRSTLRGDEVLTLFWNRENPTLGDMIRSGAKGQVSPAPLYYLVTRAVDESRNRLGYLGLTPSGYYRLPSLLFSAGLGAAAAWLIARRLRRQEEPVSPVAYVLVLCAVAVYWFQPKVFSFACIDRPYSLWNGLWFLSLAWLLARPESRLGLGILLSIMATTATAACFQILAVGIAFAIVRRREGRAWKDLLREGALIFSVPAALGAYYAFQSEPMDADPGIPLSAMVRNHLTFWLVTNAHVWIAVGLCGALLLLRPRLQAFALPVLALGVLLLLVPLIAALARSKGYSSPSRQYIWTSTAIPLALFLAALSWPELSRWKPAPKLGLALAVGLVAAFSFTTFLRPQARNDSRRLACLDRGSPLEVLLRHERPRWICFPEKTGDIEKRNIRLLLEWIPIRYAGVPRGTGAAPLRDVNGELISDPIVPRDQLPAGYSWTVIGTGD